MARSSPELDIVIPVYNEGANILRVLSALESSVRADYRVLVCYDADTDDTLAALREHRGARPVVPVKNRYRGVHGAIASGFEAGDSPAVLVYPADDTFNAELVDKLMERFRAGADIVAPSRFMRGGCMKGCPPLKATLVRASAFILYHLARIPTHDPSNGFRLFSRRVIRQIPLESSQGFAFSIEYLVKCHRLGWRIEEVPAQWHEREGRKSRFHVFKWMPIYLRWFSYAFATTFLGRRAPAAVPAPVPAKVP